MKYTNFKLKLRAFFAVFAMVIFAVTASAQKVTVTGIVNDAVSGESILGANILEKGTGNGTITNLDGKFSISVSPNATLVVKYVGYKPQEILVAGQKNLVIKLEEDAVAINEVMVIGYGTVKKNDATGSITSIKPDKLNKGLTTNAQDMIMGKVAGVTVTTDGGTPGGGATIRIRGGSSLNASNDPLIVIDGLPMDNKGIKGVANPLSTINPNDIESFTVLKDASATAIYGSRASNGVIIITTKKGEKGSKPKISYDANMSIGTIKKMYEGLNGDQFRALVNGIFDGDLTDPAKNLNDSITRSLLGASNTNWQKEIYRTAIGHDHNVTISGGFKNAPYRASINYTNQNGIIKTSNFERLTGSLNISPSLFNNHLKINLNVKGMSTTNRFANNGVIGAAAVMDPTQPVMSTDSIHVNRFGGYWEWYNMDKGKFNGANNMATRNPVATLNNTDDRSKARSFIGNADIDYKLHFFPDMRVHLNLGIDNSYGKQTLNIPTTAAGNYPYGRTGWDETYKTNEMLNVYAQYSKEFGKHNFDVMVGYEWQHFYRKGENEYRGLIKTDTNLDNVVDDTDDYFNHIYPAKTSWATESYLISLFGRINYSLLNKYLFTATFRNDNSSRFSKQNGLQAAYFPSFAFAWKMNEETFIKEIGAVSEMKLRLGYGSTGQQEINQGDYPYIPVYTQSVNGAYYQFGDQYVLTSRPEAFNSNIKWEETVTYNAGYDLGLWNNRFTASVDYYHRVSNDLINEVFVPSGTNFRNKVVSNVGQLTNDGIELMLNYKPFVKKDFTWDISYNIAYNKNKITKISINDNEGTNIDLGGTFQGSVLYHAKGQASRTFLVLEQRYNADGKPIEEGSYIDPSNPSLGTYKDIDAFVDRNNDNVINDNDRYFGKSTMPDITMGFATKVIYKNFDLGITLRSSIGNYVFNAVASGGSKLGPNGVYDLGYFSNKPTSALYTNFQGTSTRTYQSDYYIENASFVKCDNITLGYSFEKLFNFISSGRLYATVQNPFVITKYTGLDPEVFGGIDNDIYPRPLMTIVGFSLNF